VNDAWFDLGLTVEPDFPRVLRDLDWSGPVLALCESWGEKVCDAAKSLKERTSDEDDGDLHTRYTHHGAVSCHAIVPCVRRCSYLIAFNR
jgi:hypothetical protein